MSRLEAFEKDLKALLEKHGAELDLVQGYQSWCSYEPSSLDVDFRGYEGPDGEWVPYENHKLSVYDLNPAK